MSDVPSARRQLIDATIRHLSAQGPASVRPQDICEELGLSKPLVNYHFGSRDGLILEAMATAYEAYVDELMAAADASGNDPVGRLLAWIDRQVDWTADNPGLAAALDFPAVAIGTPNPADPAQQRLAAAGTRNFGNLQQLVREARAQLRGIGDPAELEAGDVGFAAAVVGWLALGMSVWVGGDHLPTREANVRQFLPMARAHVRTVLLDILARP